MISTDFTKKLNELAVKGMSDTDAYFSTIRKRRAIKDLQLSTQNKTNQKTVQLKLFEL